MGGAVFYGRNKPWKLPKKNRKWCPISRCSCRRYWAFLDQMVKVAVYNWLRPVGDLPLIEGVIHLTYLENRGWPSG